VKEEFNKDMESLKKRESNRIPGNKKLLKSNFLFDLRVESHSSRPEQEQDRA
jgi:hypothetical protein